ncbi:MAG: WecB/TagA/CpsF family glycosyltransferase [Kiritimatiellia bacterium]|jgi:N-acetylglucosaminyldiphosphoundecaprenol N-acetyl-beta-D-mannosaminyltransferase|nr:WecB/TagA/CpsF family glycosyltransferase [Kiritimatiellia bacterium]MDP6811170.1 WecB/TagA/CpsF family glycosyltransferase [Kiritimatiellia bacterium]MDP7025273.1 WecB/TagA/CpsF family glycosyltransferase [Kiritimatiellia bacterium]
MPTTTTTATALDLPSVRIFGVTVSGFLEDQLNEYIRQSSEEHRKCIVANVNIHALNLAFTDPRFRSFLQRSDYVFCDGHGVVVSARLLGSKIPPRITYADWLPRFARFCAAEGLSIFLLGGRAGIAETAADKLKGEATGLRVAGTFHGYFDRTRNSPGSLQAIERINATKPDILIVCMGMPLQEYWIEDHWADIQATVALTGGAALDYVSGNLRRPPQWLTDHGMEWLGRLAIEPGRLANRYIVGLPLFFLRLAASTIRTWWQ